MPIAKKLIHGYYASVSYVDAQIGVLIEGLTELGLRENTVIVLVGDHGWSLSDHGLWAKHSNFEVALQVPLIISDSGSTYCSSYKFYCRVGRYLSNPM